MTSLADLQEALRKDSRNPGLWVRMGVELLTRGRNDRALVCFERAADLSPGHVDAIYNRGIALHAMGRVDEALRCYESVVAEAPGHPSAEDNRLAALVTLGRADEALPGLERRIAQGVRSADTLVNLGLARQARGELDAALAAFESALATSPGHRLAGWNLALLELRLGRIESGRERYEAYWPGTSPVNRIRDFARPLWQPGENLAGHSILLHADEGLGDTIQHLRFVPGVVRRARRVVLEVPRALGALARSLGGGFEIVESGAQLPATDLHAPLHALARRLAADGEPEGQPPPYLQANPARVSHWRTRLRDGRGVQVGIAWRGSASYADDRWRSIPLGDLVPLFDVEGVRLVGLQLAPPDADAAALALAGAPEDFAAEARGLDETAALIGALDLVVSVDTALAHLAGALGRPVWVLLGARADPRWLEGTDRSASYPSARLYRAARGETWDAAVARLRPDLQRFAKLRP